MSICYSNPSCQVFCDSLPIDRAYEIVPVAMIINQSVSRLGPVATIKPKDNVAGGVLFVLAMVPVDVCNGPLPIVSYPAVTDEVGMPQFWQSICESIFSWQNAAPNSFLKSAAGFRLQSRKLCITKRRGRPRPTQKLHVSRHHSRDSCQCLSSFMSP